MSAIYRHPDTGEVRTPAEMHDAAFGYEAAVEQLIAEGFEYWTWEI